MQSNLLKKAREYESTHSQNITPEQRPAFHLSSLVGWMNDPNGFSYYAGKYHLFYQYHPYDLRWGPMHWGHAVSTDFIRWEFEPCALAPDEQYDSFGCFSGSALETADGKHLIMYTGVEEVQAEDGTTQIFQTQCVAVGDGVNYEKYQVNPVIDKRHIPEEFSTVDFRDPKIWQEADGSYRVVVANRHADGSGALLVFRSQDAYQWEFETVLDQSFNEIGKMWECPDYFKLDGRDVILISPQDMTQQGLEFHNGNGTVYIVGTYNDSTKKIQRETVQAIDYGLDFYAPQTLLTPDGRRVMVAWMQNWDACVPPPAPLPWYGQMTIPRELSVKNGKLIQNPVRELEQYRGHGVNHSTTLSEETMLQGVCGRVVDMTVEIEPTVDGSYQKFTMKLASGTRYFTSLTYNAADSILHFDRNHSGLCRDIVSERRFHVRNQQGKLKLRILMDRFSVEIFVNDGEQAFTSTIYTPLSSDGITFACDGELNLSVEKFDLNL